MIYDYVIVGGGIIGISTAWQLQQRNPDARILLLEKDTGLGMHQTGHNSGVIHSGIYYQPGSMKAEFCRRGLEQTINFCRTHRIKYDQCGKLVVSTNQMELQSMQALNLRSQENGIDCRPVSAVELKQLEPRVTGLGALLVKATGIVDFREICRHMAGQFTAGGGVIELANRVLSIEENESRVTLHTVQGQRQASFLVCCAGLQADRLVKLHGIKSGFQIIPFRGEYFRVASEVGRHIRHLIYPVPDPRLPFLGIHLTRMIDGSVTVGPNAVLGFKREGYSKYNFNLVDTANMLGYPGFWRLTGRYLLPGLAEMKNALFKKAYLRQVKKYCPGLTVDDLEHHPAGIRAQAVLPDGTLVHDFLFEETKRGLHVCNAPSPAATSAIPIGEYICNRMNGKVLET